MAYYGRYRRRTNWGAYHTNKRNQLTSLFAGIDTDIESIFLNLDRNSLESVFIQYGREYGDNAEKYARKTFPSWKKGATRLSGQTAERLLNLLPPFLSQNMRYELVKKLRNYYMKQTKDHVTTTPELWKQDVLPIVNKIVGNSSNFKLPEELHRRATWLSGGDAASANRILTSVEQEEAKLRTAYLDAEFRRIDQYVNIIENTQSVSHAITLPQGIIHVTIQQKKKPFINKVFGGGKVKKDSRESCIREVLILDSIFATRAISLTYSEIRFLGEITLSGIIRFLASLVMIRGEGLGMTNARLSFRPKGEILVGITHPPFYIKK